MTFLQSLFNTEDLMPHGMCFLWRPGLLFSHAGADVITALAYFLISGALIVFLRRRPDIRHRWFFMVFGTTVFAACGLSHLIAAWTLWSPDYGVAAMIKGITAVASLIAAVLLWRLMPSIISFPTPAQMASARDEIVHLAHRNQAILNAAGEGICGLDGTGRITFANPAAGRMLGWAADSLVGRSVDDIIADGQGVSVFHGRADRRRHGHFRRADSSSFQAEYVSTAFVQNGEAGAVVVFRDITDQRQAEAELLKARDDAETSSRSKTDFLANVSHELRTPLNAIIGFSDAMGMETFGPLANDHYREYVGHIKSSGEHLLELINDILDVSAIEAGRLDLYEEALDLPDLADAALRLVRLRAEKGGVVLTTEAAPDLPPLRADRRRVKQIMANLLSNAVKFTPRGETVRLSIDEAPEGGLIVAVHDTGIGMSEDDIARAMEPFGQVDSSLARREEGTGLGLPLVNGLTVLHAGTMTIDSQPGVGTTVRITFPPERTVRDEKGKAAKA